MTEAERIQGVALHALIDNLQLQVGIIGPYAVREADGPFARWVEIGSTVGIAAVVDLEFMARAMIEALSSTGTMPAQALSAPLPADPMLDDPFPPPAPAKPAGERPAPVDGVIRCVHCGRTISRQMPPGSNWRHNDTLYLSCDPAGISATTMAEPA